MPGRQLGNVRRRCLPPETTLRGPGPSNTTGSSTRASARTRVASINGTARPATLATEFAAPQASTQGPVTMIGSSRDPGRGAAVGRAGQCSLAVPVGHHAVGHARQRRERLDLEHVAGLRALDEHRTGDHMWAVDVEVARGARVVTGDRDGVDEHAVLGHAVAAEVRDGGTPLVLEDPLVRTVSTVTVSPEAIVRAGAVPIAGTYPQRTVSTADCRK
jgi:hypothetical protein